MLNIMENDKVCTYVKSSKHVMLIDERRVGHVLIGIIGFYSLYTS